MRTLVVLLFLTTLLPHANASTGECGGQGINVIDFEGIAYVDDRMNTGNGVWTYAESNGEAGLQRGGGSIANPAFNAAGLPEDNEICFDDSTNGPDTLIF